MSEMTDEKQKEKELRKMEKEKEREAKKLEKQSKSKDGLVVGIIVAIVVLIALAIFGFFVYNKNLKAVVKYDSGSVSVDDFEVYYKTFAPMLQYFYGYTNDDAEALGEIIAEKAASDMIIVNRAKKAGIKISDEDKKYVDDLFADEAEVQVFIDSGINPSRMQQFYYNDYIMDDYKEYLGDKLEESVVEAYIKENYGEDADMREYKTQHILFKNTDSEGNKLSDEALAEKKKKAEEILAKALAGEDFAELAKANSEDGTAQKGGEFTFYMDGSVDKDYSNAATSLEAGKVADKVIETQFGYHIIKLVEYNEKGRLNSKEIRKEIVNKDLANVTDEEHVEIQTDVLKEVLEKIVGKSTSKSDDNTTDENTTDENTTVENKAEGEGENKTENTEENKAE